MADKSFGIKELNLISSGTPKIESPNNLNLSAVTVAISTNATVGGTLDVDGHTELDDVNISGVSTFAGITTVTGQTLFTKQLGVSGITTFNSIVNFPGASYNALWNKAFNRFEFKDGASAVFGTGNDLEIKHSGGNTTLKNITGQFRIAGNDIRIQNQTSSTDFIKVNSTGSVVTGILTATSYRSSTTTGDGSDVAFATKYYITANGSSAYRFAGAGVLNTTDDPTLYFHRGFTYILENSTGGSHPFELRLVSGGSAYAPGGQFLTGSTTGTQILTVPMDAPASIVYQCTIHGSMLGTINFVQ